MELVRLFKNLNKKSVELAGGKGASLGEMTQSDIPVPGGFVILSSAFEKFLEETDLNVEIDSILRSVNHKEIHTVENASEKIKSLIISKNIPGNIKRDIKKFFKNLDSKYAAVRSSATAEDSASAAWAGQLESYLNTTEKKLFENIKKCWASLFTPRAIFYRFEKGLHKQKISVAVVVQKMVDSEVSGIAFSVHPVTQDKNQIIIEAGFGLGEAVVSGQITPDSYVVEKQSQKIIDKNIERQFRGLYRSRKGGNEWQNIPKEKGSRQVLSDDQIRELSGIILAIEKHYDFPCDIEWAFAKNKFYVVQSRPITTLINNLNLSDLSINSEVVGQELEDKYLLPQKYIHWGQWKQPVLSWSFWEYWSLARGAKKIPLKLNYSITPIFIVDGHFFIYESDFYKNLIKTFYKELSGGKTVLIDYFFKEAEYIDKKISNFIRKNKNRKNKKYIEDAFSVHREAMFVWSCIVPFDTALNKKTQELSEKYNLNWHEIAGYFSMPFKPMSMQDKDNLIRYKNILKKIGLKNILSIKEIESRDKKIAENILKYQKDTEYIGTHHFWGKPRLLKDFLSAVSLASNDKEMALGRKNFPKEIIGIAQLNMRASVWRLQIAERIAQLEYSARESLIDLAKKFHISYDDLICLSDQEIIEFININNLPLEMKDKIKKRKKKFAGVMGENSKMKIWTGKECRKFEEAFLLTLKRASEKISKKLIKGIVANRGIARGRAVIVLDPKDISKVRGGMILVAPATSPDYLPAMKKAIAFVTDTGGITCHAAIVSREMNKPCVIGTKDATKILKDGDMIEINGENGTIKLIDKK